MNYFVIDYNDRIEDGVYNLLAISALLHFNNRKVDLPEEIGEVKQKDWGFIIGVK